jgi:hypothetical protein
MKLRLKNNSIRLRLLRTEVEELRETGNVSERIFFTPSDELSYSIQIVPGTDLVSAKTAAGRIEITVPEKAAKAWMNSDEEVGIYANQETGNMPLQIIVEKDFVCLDRPDDADRPNAFPHPKTRC